MADGKPQYLPTNHIQPNPLQPRGEIKRSELSDLMDSIEQHGIIEPLVIAETPAGYQIIAGERRWRAAKHLNLQEVPVIIKKTTPQGMLEMALIENVQRMDLNAIERAKGFQRLMSEFGLSNAQVAKKVGKSASYVSNSLRLLDLPDALKDGLIGGMISEGHARALSAIDDRRAMVEAYKIVLKEGASVRRAEELARRMKDAKIVTRENRKTEVIIDDRLDEWREKLERALGKKSRVKLSRSRSQTKVAITLKGSPIETQEKLEKIMKIAE